ncbi:MAG: phosphatase PAP2 family protein [Pirellulales bacterium]|nr:phosphatase PAP2 family protein [Pirellulales bacterium]
MEAAVRKEAPGAADPRPVWRLFDSRWGWLFPPALLLLALAAIPTIDAPLARWFLQEKCPDNLRHVFEEAEPFGNAVGAIVLTLIIWRVDRRVWLADLALLLVSSLGAGLASNVFKLCFVRARPRIFSFEGTAWQSFQGLFPPLGHSSDLQSFPSAHVASAFGLALALALLYPRLKDVFLILAITVGLQRMECGAHFASDTLAGAAVGIFVALCTTKWHLRVWRMKGRAGQPAFAAPAAAANSHLRGPKLRSLLRPNATAGEQASARTPS